MDSQRQYIAIDLKSFYASVECVERGLDPLTTNLVVADVSRTEKTICLAVTPSLKAYGISGRARLFEVVEKVREVNMERLCFSPEGIFTGRSSNDTLLQANMGLELDYIAAPPRMKLYMDYSQRIYNIYLRYIAPEDIFAYSIDEVFIDVTNYLAIRKINAHDMARMMIKEVLDETGITATAGIGTNIYLSKVAMDIVAKHTKADKDGVRIAELDEMSYRRLLWNHRPLSDFWRVGRATMHKLESLGMKTMGDIARKSLTDEDILYKAFGINAELLIDHAWGWEPMLLQDAKKIKSKSKSFSSGQVLKEPYTSEKARIVVREMANELALRLTEQGVSTKQLILYIGYDTINIEADITGKAYDGPLATDFYGRQAPPSAHGSRNLKKSSNSLQLIGDEAVALFDSIVNKKLFIRRMNIAANNIIADTQKGETPIQLDLFDNPEETNQKLAEQKEQAEREKRLQEAAIAIQNRFGKNSILLGTSFEEGATAQERHVQIGGHKA